jgi:hypothetical protein
MLVSSSSGVCKSHDALRTARYGGGLRIEYALTTDLPDDRPATTWQFDLFATPPDPLRHADVPIDPLHGLFVQLSDTCQCGSRDVAVGEGKGPHRASFFCSRCDRHRGWMSNEAHAFLTEVVKNFGKPTVPIRIRRKKNEGD